jgi:uncharacterized membrane protein
MPYFYIFQAVVHLILGLVGKQFLNLGMLSAWLVYVPWGIWTTGLLVRAGVIAYPYWNDYLLNSLLVNLALPFVWLFLLVRCRRGQQYRQQP